MNRNTGIEKNKRIYLYALLIGYACLLMFFCTKSSPLYIINDWYDANAYFTMGKGMMNGAVPYRDLFDTINFYVTDNDILLQNSETVYR